MDVVASWTGAEADALREALRMSNEAFAEHLGVAERTVANWRARPGMVPSPAAQEILDAALARAPGTVKERFRLLLAGRAEKPETTPRRIEREAVGGAGVATPGVSADAPGTLAVSPFDAEAGAEDDIVREQDSTLLIPLRRLLLPVVQTAAAGSLDEADLTPARLGVRVLACTADYDRARYAKLAADIPTLVQSIEAAVGLHENEAKADVYRLLAQVYIITARLLIQLRDESLACEAVRRAMDAAENAGDPVLRAAAAQDYAWAFRRQMLFAEAEETAVGMAAELGEPSITRSTPEHLAVWGRLLEVGSIAAAFRNRSDTARELLSHASSAAARIGAERMDYGKYWANFSPIKVAITRADVAQIEGDAPLALHLGKKIQRPESLRLDAWTYHLALMAEAQVSTRDYVGAIETIKSIHGLAPQWIKNDRVAHDVVLRLLDATTVPRQRQTGLDKLAAFMEVQS